MKKYTKLTTTILPIIALSTMTANAAIIQLSGDFCADFDQNATSSNTFIGPQGITQISGNWSLTYDEANVAPGPNVQFYNVSLDTFTLNQTIGQTIFNSANVTADFHFHYGELISMRLGGSQVGASGVSPWNDDLLLQYNVNNGNFLGAWVSDGSIAHYQDSGIPCHGSMTTSTIPEPASSSLLGLGTLALVLRRRR